MTSSSFIDGSRSRVGKEGAGWVSGCTTVENPCNFEEAIRAIIVLAFRHEQTLRKLRV